MPTCRIIIALDVDTPSLEEAYRKVYRTMKGVDEEDFQWESTDEWFGDDGGLVDADEVQRIRMKVFKEEGGE